jgi:hypothetical protein
MSTTIKAKRNAKGKRPLFYKTEGLDQMMSMILVLAQEISVISDRIDSIERVTAKHGIDLAREIESLELNQEMLDARETRRQALLERLYYLLRKEAAELAGADTTERYKGVIEDLAKN